MRHSLRPWSTSRGSPFFGLGLRLWSWRRSGRLSSRLGEAVVRCWRHRLRRLAGIRHRTNLIRSPHHNLSPNYCCRRPFQSRSFLFKARKMIINHIISTLFYTHVGTQVCKAPIPVSSRGGARVPELLAGARRTMDRGPLHAHLCSCRDGCKRGLSGGMTQNASSSVTLDKKRGTTKKQ